MIKKILIKAGVSDEQNVLALGFVYKLTKEIPDSMIYIILEDGLTNFFEIFPQVSVQILDKKQKSIFGLHHFSYNLKQIYNVDFYFDLECTFKSSLIGLYFRAVERIGLYRFFLSKYFYTKTTANELNNYSDMLQLIFSLGFNHAFESNIFINLKGRYIAKDPYFLFLGDFNSVDREKVQDLIRLMSPHKIIQLTESEQMHVLEPHVEVMKSLNWRLVAEYVFCAKAVICETDLMGDFCSSLGVPSYVVNPQIKKRNKTFYAESFNYIELSGQGLISVTNSGQKNEIVDMPTLSQFFQNIYK